MKVVGQERQFDATDEERLAQYDDDGAALRALLALDAGGMASWRWDIETNMITGDDRLANLYGFERGHWPIPLGALTTCVHPDDEELMLAAIDRSLQSGEEYQTEFRVRRTSDADPRDDSAWRWLGGRGRPSQPSGRSGPTAMLGVNWDITDRKLSEQRMIMTAIEMDHRVKNAFAVMRALVNIGRRKATDLSSFANDLSAQVQAMADGHEVAARLSREGIDPRPLIPIAEVLQTVLAPWLNADADRVTLAMDSRLMVPTGKVSALSMLLHELMTNAAKHGALRPSGGRLHVSLDEIRRDSKSYARLVWTEMPSNPLHDEAAGEGSTGTSGFGSVLIEHCMCVLAASHERTLRPNGLRMTVALPVSLRTEDD